MKIIFLFLLILKYSKQQLPACNSNNDEAIASLANTFETMLDQKTLKEYSNWIEINVNDEDVSESKIRCKICAEYYNRNPKGRSIPSYAQEGAELSDTIQKNANKLRKHQNTLYHQNAVKNLGQCNEEEIVETNIATKNMIL